MEVMAREHRRWWDTGPGVRAALWMRVVVVTVIIGWELWTLFVDDPSYPTLSVVIHHIWRSRAALITSYVLWVWLGWWIVRPLPGRGRRGARIAAAPAVAAFAWWATSLPHDVWRWPSLGIPAAVLLSSSFALQRFHHKTGPATSDGRRVAASRRAQRTWAALSESRMPGRRVPAPAAAVSPDGDRAARAETPPPAG